MFGTPALIWFDSLRVLAALGCVVTVAVTPYVLIKGKNFGWPRQLRIAGAALVGVAITGGYLASLGDAVPSVWRLALITMGALAQAVGMVAFVARERYRTDEQPPTPRPVDLLAHIPAALIVADAQSRMLSVAGDAHTILGWAPTELKGRPLAAIIPARYVPKHLAAIDRLVATGETSVAGKLLPLYAVDRLRQERPITLMVLPLPGSRFLGVLLAREVDAGEM